jgi:hypothetical protein
VIGGEDAGLYFRHTDHLGSTSVISDSNGDKVSGSTVVYAPFGEIRYGEQSDLTDFGFTGQQRSLRQRDVPVEDAQHRHRKAREELRADVREVLVDGPFKVEPDVDLVHPVPVILVGGEHRAQPWDIAELGRGTSDV